MSRHASTVAVIAALAVATTAGDAGALVWPDVPERVERGLASADAGARRAAARELASLGAARATPLVLKAMGDADVEVRLAATDAAIRLRVEGATEAALLWLGDREARLRVAACEVAGAIPSAASRARVVPALARAIGDADAQVRGACADALGVQASPEAVAPLAGKLDDPTPAVRVAVAHALAKLGDPRAVVPLVGKVQDSVPEVRQAVVRALGDLGDARATQALLLALRDNLPDVKVEALSALGRLRAPEAAVAIAPLVLERSPSVRQAALVALGRIATRDAVRALVKALGTQDDGAGTLDRTAVREALVAAGPPAVDELTALLERPLSAPVATSAAWVLGELRATKSAPAIVGALRKGTLPPAAALHALAGAGTAEQVPVVLEFVADPSPAVREEARGAAAALLDPSRPDGRAVEPLAATLRAPRTSSTERAAVAALLGRTGAPRAAAELAGLVGAQDVTLRLSAIDALGALGAAPVSASTSPATARASDVVDDALVPLLTDENAAVRLHAAIALAASGGAKARSALIAKLDDPGERGELDRYALFAALGGIVERLPDEGTASRLFQELAIAAGPERDAVLEAAGRARLASTVRRLAELTKTADADDRRAIASGLAAPRGTPVARDALALARALGADADGSVRAQAAFALGRFGDGTVLPLLATLAKDGDGDVATNAAGAVARLAAEGATVPASAITGAACAMLADGRAPVRANALAALAFARARCADGRLERKIVAEDASEIVRAAAARTISAAPLAEDRAALDKCAAGDRSSLVARLCRERGTARDGSRDGAAAPPRAPHAVTIFLAQESGAPAKPRAPYLIEYAGGVLRSGTADRRGAVFEPNAPAGDVTLRRR